MILESKLLAAIPGIRHGFATRLGGVSTSLPHATLDFGVHQANDPTQVARNVERFTARLGLPAGAELVQVNQVHGAEVLDERHVPRDLASTGARWPDADALVSARPGIAVGVRTADCVPLLAAALEEGVPRAVAAIHAGWRGAVLGVAANAVAALRGRVGARARIVVALGPAIGPGAFEVGEEVVEAARTALGGATPPMTRAPGERPHLDLRALVVELLRRVDLPARDVELCGGCTFEAPALYFSHRRDRGVTGRHLSAIALVPER